MHSPSLESKKSGHILGVNLCLLGIARGPICFLVSLIPRLNADDDVWALFSLLYFRRVSYSTELTALDWTTRSDEMQGHVVVS